MTLQANSPLVFFVWVGELQISINKTGRLAVGSNAAAQAADFNHHAARGSGSASASDCTSMQGINVQEKSCPPLHPCVAAEEHARQSREHGNYRGLVTASKNRRCEKLKEWTVLHFSHLLIFEAGMSFQPAAALTEHLTHTSEQVHWWAWLFDGAMQIVNKLVNLLLIYTQNQQKEKHCSAWWGAMAFSSVLSALASAGVTNCGGLVLWWNQRTTVCCSVALLS